MNTAFEGLLNTIAPTDGEDPGTYDMLRNSLRRVDGIIGLILLSNEGIAKAAYGLPTDEAQMVAAACSGMASLSSSMSHAVGGNDVRCDWRVPHRDRHAAASIRPRKTPRPSSEPTSRLIARSGWGMRPRTIPFSLAIPAMDRADPFGFAAAVTRPSSST